MDQVQYFMRKLNNGETFDVKFEDVDDINHYYSIHTVIILGANNTVCDITMDGLDLKLSSGFVYNITPVNLITVNTAPSGVLIIGKKTRKTIFQPLTVISVDVDNTVNEFVENDYVEDYFE